MCRRLDTLGGSALLSLIFLFAVEITQGTEQGGPGLRGDPAAIRDATALVEAMGGLVIWKDLRAVGRGDNGLVRYEMVSLTGSNVPPYLSLFAPPAEHIEN